jgi:CBS domain-containing protein
MKTAKDIMTREVITVSPDTSVEELGRLFIEKNISGAPVVDSEGKLYGIVTENDLIQREKKFHIPTIIRIFDAILPLERESKVEEEIRRMTATVVKEICTKEVITIEEDTPLGEIATIMSEKKVHLLPVLKEGRIVGIVGKKDVIRAITSE